MQRLFVILLTCALCSHAILNLPWDELTVFPPSVQIVAAYPDTTCPELVSLSGPTSLTNSTLVTITATVAYFGSLRPSTGQVTFQIAGSTQGYNVVLGVHSFNNTHTILGTYDGQNCPFTDLGTYGVSIVFQTSACQISLTSQQLQTQGLWNSVSVTGVYTPKVITSFYLPAAQTGGCTSSGCGGRLIGNLTVNTPGMTLQIFLRSLHPDSGITFFTTCTTTSNWVDFSSCNQLTASFGGTFYDNQHFPYVEVLGREQPPVKDSMAEVFVTITDNPIQGVGPGRAYYSSTQLAAAGFPSQMQFTDGQTSDLTAPTCTIVYFETDVFYTNLTFFGPLDFGFQCSDETGGSGIFDTGFYYGIENQNGLQNIGGVETLYPYQQHITLAANVSGSVHIYYIFVEDYAGNRAVYTYGTSSGAFSLVASWIVVLLSLAAMSVLA